MQKVPMTQGRIVIPNAMRKKYGLADGEVVLDDRGPVLRVQALAAPYLKGRPSLADDLSRDRAAEAAEAYRDR